MANQPRPQQGGPSFSTVAVATDDNDAANSTANSTTTDPNTNTNTNSNTNTNTNQSNQSSSNQQQSTQQPNYSVIPSVDQFFKAYMDVEFKQLLQNLPHADTQIRNIWKICADWCLDTKIDVMSQMLAALDQPSGHITWTKTFDPSDNVLLKANIIQSWRGAITKAHQGRNQLLGLHVQQPPNQLGSKVQATQNDDNTNTNTNTTETMTAAKQTKDEPKSMLC